MPIATAKTLIVKMLPITITENFEAKLTLRKGVMEGETFVAMSFQDVTIAPADLMAILNAAPAEGKTRYHDLSDAIYQHVIAKEIVEGEIV